jgi:hypothetical protein
VRHVHTATTQKTVKMFPVDCVDRLVVNVGVFKQPRAVTAVLMLAEPDPLARILLLADSLPLWQIL